MSAPVKPWERSANTNAQPSIYNSVHAGLPTSGVNHHHLPASSVGGGGGGTGPPPLPPRPNQISRPQMGSTYSNFTGMSPYSSFGYSPFSSVGGGYSPFSNYSYGGYGYNRFGTMGNIGHPENSFIQVAEESSRPAFESIESIVHAFGSVSMMLESTFSAVYSSFRAVLGVADNFSRLRSQFARVFSAFAVFRLMKWAYRMVLYYLGLRTNNPSVDETWDLVSSSDATPLTETDLKRPKSSWPIFMFLGIVFAAPYLIWKLLASLGNFYQEESSKWKTGECDHFVGVAQYDFAPASDQEIGLSAGQNVVFAPRELQPRVRGWLLASVDGEKTGLVPANYVKILGKKKGTQKQTEQILNFSETGQCVWSDTSSSEIAPVHENSNTEINSVGMNPSIANKSSVT